MAPSFLVTGATGSQGGATARCLLAANAVVHVLVRNTESPATQSLQRAGAVIFQGDFDDKIAISAATAGVSGVFLNPFPAFDPELQIRQAQNFIDAAIDAQTVESIVLSTAFFTASRDKWDSTEPSLGLQAYYSQKAAIEEAVRQSGLKYTILRPSFLMQNYLPPQATMLTPELASEGMLAHIYEPGTKMPHIDAADIGKFAATALLQPKRFREQEIELGSENLTIEQVAALMNEVDGVEVGIRKRSVQEIKRVWDHNPSLRFQKLANDKDLSINGAALADKYGIRLTRFAEFLTREKEALAKSILRKEPRGQ